jgi:hypothetical protein
MPALSRLRVKLPRTSRSTSFTTHMETQQAVPVQLAQANELIQLVNASPLPVILAGAFNSAANPSAPA